MEEDKRMVKLKERGATNTTILSLVIGQHVRSLSCISNGVMGMLTGGEGVEQL